MPVTRGHGNPAWTREETILALDLFFEFEAKAPDESHEKVIALSDYLRSMPVHSAAARQESFRNPAGVAFKLQNLRQVATGRGLSNSSRTDRAIWSEFGQRREIVAELAAEIRKANQQLLAEPPGDYEADEDEEFAEGKTITRLHKQRERNRSLRKKVLANRRLRGSLKCEVCGTGPTSVDPLMDDAIFEVHHDLSPVAAGERKTKLSDLALLCANCHRNLHRMIKVSGAWIAVAAASSRARAS